MISFLRRHGMAAWVACFAITASAHAIEFFVSPDGSDAQPGTAAAPFATIEHARDILRATARHEAAIVWLQGGVYRVTHPLIFAPEDGGTADAPIMYAAVKDEQVEISGAQGLNLQWSPLTNGQWSAKVPAGIDFDQLFADGKKLIRARYPNFDPGEGFFGGLSRDATDPERLRKYADPAGVFVHGYHGLGWGSLHFQILEKSPQGNYAFEAGKDARVAGGWQNKGRAAIAEAPFSPDQRFVENIFEELDAPREWFLDRRSSTLYFIPPTGADPRRMTFEAVTVKHLIEICGSQTAPVRNLTFRGLIFRRANYTFMETTNVPSGGDWRIYRGGAITVEGAEDCAFRDCTFDGLGGNGIFVKNYNRGVEITGCEFTRLGASAILFEGNDDTVRSRWAHSWGWPASEIGPMPAAANTIEGKPYLALLPTSAFDNPDPLIDLQPGPKTDNYPARCLVQDCLIHDIGTVEKQISGVFISKSRDIVVNHVTIHDVPRAAININDGMWGGQIIEWCDIFNTCLESREHGAINAWGRDRYWVRMSPKTAQAPTFTPEQSNRIHSLSRVDAVDANILRYNRVQCARGYDIDLDDGSSNFDIYDNLCLQGGIKLREGLFRTVRNNITPLISAHVWYADSHDVVMQNIVVDQKAYSPQGIEMGACKDARFDFNLFASYSIPKNLQLIGLDRHSVTADPQFINPARGDYRVQAGSPAEKIGFVNFPVDEFGVVSPQLKSRTAVWSGLGSTLKVSANETGESPLYQWLGATLRNVVNLGRESAIVGSMELSDNRGILIKAVDADSVAARGNIPPDAVIFAANDAPLKNIADLTSAVRAAKGSSIRLKILTAKGYIEVQILAAHELPELLSPAATHE